MNIYILNPHNKNGGIIMCCLEENIIRQCSPTLAGLKMANLFNYGYEKEEILNQEISKIEEKLNSKGVFIECLKKSNSNALLYVYRKNILATDLQKEEIVNLLSDYGYDVMNAEAVINKLKDRISHSSCFPHEIGVFLGYPIDDVKAFICNKGKNCLLCGVWKVYCNVAESQKIFDRYRKCTDIYLKMFAEKKNIMQLTVSV